MSTGTDSVVLVGASDALCAVEAEITCAARTDAKVLITGETGAGKEVVARLIHQRSVRAAAPFLTLNCAGIPDTLLESELFGHVRGSFTDAFRDKPGLLELASGGTMFLDEVGEMSMRMQAVLLRFLETGELQRLGAHKPHGYANVRILTATNRDLQKQIASGAFREDLYFRLNVVRIVVPPLRERLQDVPALVEHFAGLAFREHRIPRAEFLPAAIDAMRAYGWPGNVRELKNVIERSMLRANGRAVTIEDLPCEIVGRVSQDGNEPTSHTPAAGVTIVDRLLGQMLEGGESFWATVYPLFIARDLTRTELRAIVQRGLETSNGSYRALVVLFNMPADDYKRFLGFLRKHDCHLAFQRFRTVAATLTPRTFRLATGSHG